MVRELCAKQGSLLRAQMEDGQETDEIACMAWIKKTMAILDLEVECGQKASLAVPMQAPEAESAERSAPY